MQTSPAKKIIAMWCHPRSMSTATERIMRERGDLSCFHEPFLYYYYGLGDLDFPHFAGNEGAPTAFTDIMQMLQQANAKQQVFIKDMAFYIYPEVAAYADAMAAMAHVFLVRDPRKSIMSYHKLQGDFTCQEVGYESQWRLYNWLIQLGITPIVMAAESIQQAPQQMMNQLWQRLGLAAADHAFNWQGSKQPEQWRNVAAWHQDVIHSNGIRTPQRDDGQIAKDFAALCKEQPHLLAYYEHHLPYYQRLMTQAMPQAKKQDTKQDTKQDMKNYEAADETSHEAG